MADLILCLVGETSGTVINGLLHLFLHFYLVPKDWHLPLQISNFKGMA